MAGPHTLTFTDANFSQEVLQSEHPVLVDFWAPWCGPCRLISPIIDEIANECAGKARLGKVNVDDCRQLATKFRVTSIPMLLFLKGGEIKDQVVGAGTSKASLISRLEALA